jgi:hypothetical protein
MQNANPNTGIRYGVIRGDSLDPDTLDEIFDLPSTTYASAIEESTRALRREISDHADDLIDTDYAASLDVTDKLNDCIDLDDLLALADDLGIDASEHNPEYWQFEEENREGKIDGVNIGLSWLGGAVLVWVFDSPIITRALLCSPCVPNAGDLNNIDQNGFECYGIPPNWYATEDNV